MHSRNSSPMSNKAKSESFSWCIGIIAVRGLTVWKISASVSEGDIRETSNSPPLFPRD